MIQRTEWLADRTQLFKDDALTVKGWGTLENEGTTSIKNVGVS